MWQPFFGRSLAINSPYAVARAFDRLEGDAHKEIPYAVAAMARGIWKILPGFYHTGMCFCAVVKGME